jgi:hypothetical protein
MKLYCCLRGPILLLHTTLLFALNFEVAIDDTIKEGLPGEEIAISGYIINLTDISLDIEINRKINQLPDNWTSSLCLQTCAVPWVDTISGVIPPQDSVEFSIHFLTSSEPGEGYARLVFKEQNESETISHLFIARTAATNIETYPEKEYSFQLLGNYPNPFNSATSIRYESAKQICYLKLKIYNVIGKLVSQMIITDLPAGINEIWYNGTDIKGRLLPSGIYIYYLSIHTIDRNIYHGFNKFLLLK